MASDAQVERHLPAGSVLVLVSLWVTTYGVAFVVLTHDVRLGLLTFAGLAFFTLKLFRSPEVLAAPLPTRLDQWWRCHAFSREERFVRSVGRAARRVVRGAAILAAASACLVAFVVILSRVGSVPLHGAAVLIAVLATAVFVYSCGVLIVAWLVARERLDVESPAVAVDGALLAERLRDPAVVATLQSIEFLRTVATLIFLALGVSLEA